MSFWGIVPAAGMGRRFGARKQEVRLGDRPLWAWARDALMVAGAIDVVVVGPVPGGIAGGPRRRDSVAAGLEAVPRNVPYVLVHDAARPLATAELAARVAARIERGDTDGVVPALPVRDTVKNASDGWIIGTVDRSGLVAVQTPQGFKADVLRAAHRAYQDDVTDDASLIELAGGRVATVPGEPGNLKVTYPEDLATIEAMT